MPKRKEYKAGHGCRFCNSNTKVMKRWFWKNQIINSHGDKFIKEEKPASNGGRRATFECKNGHQWISTIQHTVEEEHSCPYCYAQKQRYSRGEEKIQEYLIKNNIKFYREYRFNNCRSQKTNFILYFDFYLPEYNICIEYDGIQHFKQNEFFEKHRGSLDYVQEKDETKNQYCRDNHIKLIRIPYTQFENIEYILYKEIKW